MTVDKYGILGLNIDKSSYDIYTELKSSRFVKVGDNITFARITDTLMLLISDILDPDIKEYVDGLRLTVFKNLRHFNAKDFSPNFTEARDFCISMPLRDSKDVNGVSNIFLFYLDGEYENKSDVDKLEVVTELREFFKKFKVFIQKEFINIDVKSVEDMGW